MNKYHRGYKQSQEDLINQLCRRHGFRQPKEARMKGLFRKIKTILAEQVIIMLVIVGLLLVIPALLGAF